MKNSQSVVAADFFNFWLVQLQVDGMNAARRLVKGGQHADIADEVNMMLSWSLAEWQFASCEFSKVLGWLRSEGQAVRYSRAYWRKYAERKFAGDLAHQSSDGDGEGDSEEDDDDNDFDSENSD